MLVECCSAGKRSVSLEKELSVGHAYMDGVVPTNTGTITRHMQVCSPWRLDKPPSAACKSSWQANHRQLHNRPALT
jgi:hypothetical protein